MPTYAYACTACDHRFDIFQSFSEDSLSVCPECQGRLRKVFNAVGVVFKGGGFYRTDSRAGSSSSVAASGGAGESSSGDSASASKDSGTKAPVKAASKESGSTAKASASVSAARDGSAA